MLVMLYEHGQGSASVWKPYFDVLPSEFDTLMYWDESALDELEASAVVGKIGRGKADDMFTRRVWPIVQDQPGIFGFGVAVEEQEVVRLIMAYAFDIESDREKEVDEEGYVSEDEDEYSPKGMVPLADMLNADAHMNNVRCITITVVHTDKNRRDCSMSPMA